ncbi:tetratricopeptide repeat protein [Sediminitomix flava]|uniref:Tetratricopeptide repeat protein n=1 Tax=Sediminitomix flava TaxID=379075 RepID=A0A315ZJM9_SEDFL|nr:tetratricopeptide repeat protein [Sediminitomix flava]PWJ44894.1 tetratricopeptide repeat protein [Sediminitomix flava]
MRSPQLLILAGAVVASIGLFFMPRAVLKNNDKQVESTTSESTMEEASHMPIPANQAQEINDLQKQLASAEGEKAAEIKEKLIGAYAVASRFDSAAFYAEELYVQSSEEDPYLYQAANLYYDAFTFAVKEGRSKYFGEKAQELMGKYLESHPDSLDMEVKLGMTYINSQGPMQGVMKIREVLQKDPNHRLALFNLGLLSMRSGQFDKAKGRFEKLVSLDQNDFQSRFYLGVSMKELGDIDSAKKELLYIKEHTADPTILQTVDTYLSELSQ